MYFQDASCLQSHLNNDWAVFLRNLKRRQQCHFQLLQYNKNIIAKQREEDDQLFVKDQIIQHQQQRSRIVDLLNTMSREQIELIQKYEDCSSSEDQISKLMGRVGARVLQTCETFLQKSKVYDKDLMEKYKTMKGELIKLINQKEQMPVQAIAKLVVSYSKDKLQAETSKLSKLIIGLQNGQYERLQQIYVPKPLRPSLIVEKKKQKSVQKPKRPSVTKEVPSPIREEIRKQEKIKKQKQKFATKMTTQLYSTMDLSRTQLFEDMQGNVKQKSKQLFNEIFARNRFNREQIVEFQAKEESFHEKVKIFKQMMEKQSQRIAEVLIHRPIIAIYEEPIGDATKKNSNNCAEFQSCDDSCIIEKRGYNRYRIHDPTRKRQSKDLGANFSAVQSSGDNFKHLKFDTSNQEVYARTNRNKLPQLPNFYGNHRASSFDSRYEGGKKHQELSQSKQFRINLENVEDTGKNEKAKFSDDKQMHRPKMILKNIEVGVEGVIKKPEAVVQGREKKKRIEPNPMQYTFYVRKSGYRFFEPKSNLMT